MIDVPDDSLPDWTDEELAVLRSADDDKPPVRSLSATLAAACAGGAVASGAAAAKGASIAASMGSSITTAKWTSVVAISKWIGVVALSGAVAAGSVVLVQRTEQDHRAEARSKAAQVPARLNGPPKSALIAAPRPEPIAAEAPSAATEAREPGPVSSSGRMAVVRSQPDISLEIAALDEARTALRAGRASEALRALDRYDTGFAKAGSLRVEATALRIEALLQSGKRDRATSLANAFLARHPRSPYAARVRGLVGSGPSNP